MAKKLFQKGQSGNPKGRPKGVKDYRCFIDVLETCKKNSHDPVQKIIEYAQAKSGTEKGFRANVWLAEHCVLKPSENIKALIESSSPGSITFNFGGSSAATETTETDNNQVKGEGDAG